MDVCRTGGDGAIRAPRGGDGAEAGACVLHGARLARALCQVCPAGRVHPSGARHQVTIKKDLGLWPENKVSFGNKLKRGHEKKFHLMVISSVIEINSMITSLIIGNFK